MTAPTWLAAARLKLGTREVPGPGVNAWIKGMWLGLRGGAWYWKAYGSDDSKLPWCGAFVAWCLQQAGIAFPSRYASALAWIEWGEACGPELGAIAVLSRPGVAGSGHVGIVDAITRDGRHVRLVGGNQDDGVTAAWFRVERVRGYRRPAGADLFAAGMLPMGALSTTEA